MNVVSICMISIVGIITYVIIKGFKQEYSVVIIVALSLLFLGWMIDIFGEMETRISEISAELDMNKSFYKILFKIMGITYLCEFSSGICKDAGVSSVATQIEILGKMLILLSGIPIIISVIEVINELKV